MFTEMSLTRIPDGSVTSPRGFRAGASAAGVKEGTSRLDVALLVSDVPCVAHAVFTTSRFLGATVIVSRERIQSGRAQGVVVNSGNANAGTGNEGLMAARAMADAAAKQADVEPALMLVASTGVIGVPLPLDRVKRGIEAITPSRDGGHDAAHAIMTTDLVPKEVALSAAIGGTEVTIGGMAKGSGMIHPNMATMLAFVTTDAEIDRDFARVVLKRAADASFNQVSVDRDTSPDDTLLLMANGAAGGAPVRGGTAAGGQFEALLTAVCVDLAQKIARDGEGASRMIEVQVENARSTRDARRVAREVAASNLVKAAVYGRDPNWGRILSAVGNATVPIDPDRVDIAIGGVPVAKNGALLPFDQKAVSAAMGNDEVVIQVRLNQGRAAGRAWGCDLTESYVKINAEYTT